VVQRVGITVMLLPTRTADGIERLSKLSHRFMQNTGLFYLWLEKYPYRSIHTNFIPYISRLICYPAFCTAKSTASPLSAIPPVTPLIMPAGKEQSRGKSGRHVHG
jgi:hypothetical protein